MSEHVIQMGGTGWAGMKQVISEVFRAAIEARQGDIRQRRSQRSAVILNGLAGKEPSRVSKRVPRGNRHPVVGYLKDHRTNVSGLKRGNDQLHVANVEACPEAEGRVVDAGDNENDLGIEHHMKVLENLPGRSSGESVNPDRWKIDSLRPAIAYRSGFHGEKSSAVNTNEVAIEGRPLVLKHPRPLSSMSRGRTKAPPPTGGKESLQPHGSSGSDVFTSQLSGGPKWLGKRKNSCLS